MIAALSLCFAPSANAQQARNAVNGKMTKNLALENQEKYIEAYLEWQKLLETLRPLAPNGQETYFTCYFYYARTCYMMAIHDSRIKNRQKFVDAAAQMILKLEYAKNKDGWEIAGPMFQELLDKKDSNQLKKSYEAQKERRLKGTSFNEPPGLSRRMERRR